MKKNFILFFCLLFLAGQQVWGQTTITINLASTGGSANIGSGSYGSGAQRTWQQGSLQFGGKAITAATSPNTGAIQAQASNGVIYNIDPLPGKILSVVVTSWTGTTDQVSALTVGEAAAGRLVNATSGNYTVASGTGITSLGNATPGSWTNIAGDNRFFAIKRGTNVSYWEKIEITYENTPACTAPGVQAAALNTNNITSTGVGFSWTAGNGDASLLALRTAAQANATPASGTAYTANTDFSATTGINANNKVVYIGAGNTVNGISNLAPGTQYTASAYAYNTTDNCYNTTSPATLSFYTLSTAPSAQPATFNAVAAAHDQVNLSFSAASTIANASGYLILQKANAPMSGVPVNGTAYTVGATVGDATVAAIITSNSATSQNITGLSALNTYFYTIIPFNWNGANAPTYHYNTTNAPTASATTPTGPSSLSDIINNAGGTFYTADIDYLQYQATTITTIGSGAVAVMDLQLRDGGSAAPDADALPTQLTALTINYTGAANTIRKAALFDGATKVAEVTAGANAISFTGLSGLSAPDNGTKNFTLAVSFNTTVTDNDKLVFSVATAGTSANTVSSQMAAANGGAATSDNNTANNNNRIRVTATKISFTTNAGNTNLNVAMSPAPVVAALDINNNIDLDATGTVSLTSSGTMTGSPLTATLTNGQATFSNIIHTALGSGLVLTAQSGSFATVNSAAFNINTIPYANGDYRTTSDGNWPNTTGTWELLSGGVWSPASRPAANYSAGRIYIQHNISTSGSFASPNISIVENGKLTVNAASTIADLKVYSGGTFEAASSMTMSASPSVKNVVVESGGKFILNAATLTSNSTGSSIWNGNEDFQSGSILEIRNWNYSASSGAQRLVYSTPQISANANGYLFGYIYHYGAQTSLFGFVHGSITAKLCENDLIIESPVGASNVTFTTAGTNVEVGGNLIVNNGSFSAAASSVTTTHTIHGNIDVKSPASFRLNQQSSSANTSILLGGDLTVQGILEGTNPNTSFVNAIIFNKTGTQSIDIDGTLNNHVTFRVDNGAELVLAQNLDLPNTRNTLEVLNGGILNFNGYNVTGLGTLINSAGGTLKITSPQGITTSGAVGNVQTTTRNYDAGGTYSYAGTVLQATGNGVPAAVAKVIVNNASGVQLSQPATITGNLSLVNGLISTSVTNTLTLGTDATVSGGSNSSYINGQVTQATNSLNAKTLPIGKSGIYAPVVLTPAVNSSATFVAEYFNGAGVTPNATTFASGSDIQSIDDFQYWEVNRTSGTAAVSINLPFQSSSNIPALSRAFVAHYNGAEWENAGNAATTGTPSNGTVTSGAVNTFSPFTVGVLNSTPLPLGLDNFKVMKEASFVNLTWDNTAEAPGSKYLVERSVNGSTFETIATVNGAGKASKYAYEDRNYKTGDNYYRLTLVAIDGTTTVSKVKQVFIKAAAPVTVYPNPALDVVKVTGLADGDRVNLYNATGALAQSVIATDKIVLLKIGNLSGGVYQVQVLQSGKVIATEKLVIIK
ncbi:MAG: T9SS type A sorting domain-containing protein [Taibaiella sp.]|nr:T9SS type A sorting domain-containing protein [Taibaiella sp.]